MCFTYLVVDLPVALHCSLHDALHRMQHSLRPHTRAQYHRRFKKYLAIFFSYDLKKFDSVTAVNLFLEFLASNSFRVVFNYLSTLKHYFARYSVPRVPVDQLNDLGSQGKVSVTCTYMNLRTATKVNTALRL